MAPQRVAPSAVFDAPSRRSIVRSKLKTISEDHHPVPSELTAYLNHKETAASTNINQGLNIDKGSLQGQWHVGHWL